MPSASTLGYANAATASAEPEQVDSFLIWLTPFLKSRTKTQKFLR